MTQAARLASMDARLARASLRDGLGDIATFRHAGVNVPNCTVQIDRGVTLFGDQTQAINDQITLRAFFAQILSEPVRGDTFTVGAEIFEVDSISEKDESAVVCIVREKGIC